MKSLHLPRKFAVFTALAIVLMTSFSLSAQSVTEGSRSFMKKASGNALTLVVEGLSLIHI